MLTNRTDLIESAIISPPILAWMESRRGKMCLNVMKDFNLRWEIDVNKADNQSENTFPIVNVHFIKIW